MLKSKLLFRLLFVLGMCWYGCNDNEVVAPEETAENIYSPKEIKELLTAAGISVPFTLIHSVEEIQVVYPTTDAHGNSVQASGTILIPRAEGDFPLLSLHHGTVTKRDEVASVNLSATPEGLAGLITASIGYLTGIPDYLGFGESDILHPYLHAKTSATTVIDFLRSVKTYCNEKNIGLNGQLFLGGYSEGGYVSLAVQKEIEENHANEFTITAVAPMAGPYDLSNTTRAIIQRPAYYWPAYLGFFFTAYNDIYNWNRLDEIFNLPYGEMMPQLFDGTKTFLEINNRLPTTVSELLKQEFITNYLEGNEAEIAATIEENTLLNWVPVAPIRFYHGDADEVSPYQNALTALEVLKANGGTNIELVTIEGGTHETSGLPCVLGMIEWFNSFEMSIS